MGISYRYNSNDQGWVFINYLNYSQRRIYQYNENDFLFHFISTNHLNSKDTQLTWKQRETAN